jgi:hypothetical protein
MRNRYALFPGALAAVINALNVFGVIAWSADQVSIFNTAVLAVAGVIVGTSPNQDV